MQGSIQWDRIVTNRSPKNVWGLSKSCCPGAALQLKGDQQRIKMYYSDARELYQ